MFLSIGQFVMPAGGVKSGLKGQLVYLSKTPATQDSTDEEATDDKASSSEESI